MFCISLLHNQWWLRIFKQTSQSKCLEWKQETVRLWPGSWALLCWEWLSSSLSGHRTAQCQPGTQLLHSADITDWRGERWGGGNTSPGPFFVPLLLSFTSQLQLFKYLNNFYTGLEQSFSSFSVCLIINHQHHHASLSFSLLFIIRINLI